MDEDWDDEQDQYEYDRGKQWRVMRRLRRAIAKGNSPSAHDLIEALLEWGFFYKRQSEDLRGTSARVTHVLDPLLGDGVILYMNGRERRKAARDRPTEV